ncbi:unnamed protein product [Jaminaea pallidilutea]
MSHFTLYSHRGPGPNPFKVAIVLEKLNLSYDVIPLDFGDNADNGVKGEKFLKLNPNGRVPALVDHKNGDFVVWESGAAMFYLADQYDKEGKLLGKDTKERAIVMQWLTHQLSGQGPTQGNVNYAHRYWEATYGEKPQKSVFTRFEGETHRLYKILDDQLAKSKYVAFNDRPTIADYAFAPWVLVAYVGNIDLSPYKNVTRWIDEIKADKQVSAADAKLPKK